MKIELKILLLSICALLTSACSTQAVYTEESFSSDSPFKMRIDGDVDLVCESARRSLLGQGYLIEHADNEGVKARKAIKREDKPNTFIEMNLVCLPESKGSTLFATGLLNTYSLKKSTSSASVGVSALGSISLPIGQSADSLVKISEETIDDKDFYQRFFAAVSNILGELQAGRAPPEPIEEPATPESTMPHTSPVLIQQPVPLLSSPPVAQKTVMVEAAEPASATVAEQFPVAPEPALAPEPTPTIEEALTITDGEAPTEEAPAAVTSKQKAEPKTVPKQFPTPVSDPNEWHYD